MAFDDKTRRKLRAKLHADNIRTREVQGKTLSYMEGWHVVAEANRIFGFEGWNRETVDLRCISETRSKQAPDCAYLAKVRITVNAEGDRVTREGTGAGYAAAPTLAEAHALAAKEAETDATKRAFMTFGNPFGLALYDKDRKGVHTPTRRRADKALWEVRDGEGTIAGRYADPALSARALAQAIEATSSREGLEALWRHNEALVAALAKPRRQGRGANAGADKPVDLVAVYQRRHSQLWAQSGALGGATKQNSQPPDRDEAEEASGEARGGGSDPAGSTAAPEQHDEIPPTDATHAARQDDTGRAPDADGSDTVAPASPDRAVSDRSGGGFVSSPHNGRLVRIERS